MGMDAPPADSQTGILGYVAAHSPTVREGFRQAIRFSNLLSNAQIMELREMDDQAEFVYMRTDPIYFTRPGGVTMKNSALLGLGRYMIPIPRLIWSGLIARAARKETARLASIRSWAHHLVHDFVTREIPQVREPISPEFIGQRLEMPIDRVNAILDELEKKLILFRAGQVRGFGKAWREDPKIRAKLGWALAPEQLSESLYQEETYTDLKGGSHYLRLSNGDPIQISFHYDYLKWTYPIPR
jgi:hypothetical protein